MFATITGPLPKPSASGPSTSVSSPAGPDERLRERLAAQEAGGLGLLSSGITGVGEVAATLARGLGIDTGLHDVAWKAPITVDAWVQVAALTERPVKATIVGPYTLAWWMAAVTPPEDAPTRRRLALELAESLREELRALGVAGCPFVEIVEDAAIRIGDDDRERTAFRDAQRRLTDGIETHLSLTIRGGNADTAGAATILDAPYASYLFDLIEGPDNWRLVRQVPGERGIVCGALDHRPGEGPWVEEIVWAAHYAASANGRGLDRVGLAPGNALDACSWDEACRRMLLLGEAARLATASPEEIGRRFDPRAVDIRSAAFGRYAPGQHAPRHAPVKRDDPAPED